ncbi:MAG: 50S ribosomal protein L4, partial [Christensenellaceae bacterium]
MPKITMLKTDGSAAGEIVLSDDVFGVEVNETAIHEVVVAHLAAKRQGTQCTLTRSEVRGGGIKPWRQKGTGRARHGSIRSPQWTGGGVVFAPKPRTYYKKVNK